MSSASPCGSSAFSPWLLSFTVHFSYFITTSRMEQTVLYQSDSAITCLVPAILNLTDAVVRACSLFSSNHILPARNLKGSLHLLSSCMDLPTLVLMVQIWNLISCPSTNSAFSTICALLISLINLTLLHFTYL